MNEPTGMTVKSTEGMILLDTLNAEAVALRPSGEQAVVLELGGRVNKSERRLQLRFGISPGQAGELIAALVVAAQRADPETAGEIERAIGAEQVRMLAVDREHERTSFSLNGQAPDEDGKIMACPMCGQSVLVCSHAGVDVPAKRMSIGQARALYEREHD